MSDGQSEACAANGPFTTEVCQLKYLLTLLHQFVMASRDADKYDGSPLHRRIRSLLDD